MAPSAQAQRVAARWRSLRHLKDLPPQHRPGTPAVVLAPDLKPGMKLDYNRWMASTKLEWYPNRWTDMVVDAVDVQPRSVVVTWSGTFARHENSEYYDPQKPYFHNDKVRTRLRLDSKVNVLL